MQGVQQSQSRPFQTRGATGRRHHESPGGTPPDWKQEMMAEFGQTPDDLAEQTVRGINRTAFADWIQMEPRPRDFMTPTFRPFEGKTDPLDHIYHFQQKMALETRDEAVTCKVFSTTLVGPALLWFRQLPEKSINGFEDFCRLFLRQYAADESPREYLLRFLEVMSLVHNADSIQAAGSFVRSLQPGLMLSGHLLLNLPYDMADVQAKSEGVFRVLESHQKAPKTSAAVTTTPIQPLAPQGMKKPPLGQGPAPKQEVPAQDGLEGGKRRKTTRDPLPKYELNTPIDVVYLQNRDRGIFKDPPKSGVPEHMKNRSRYCQFHKDFGHDTVHCRNLYAQVMLAIHASRLKQYVKTNEDQPRQDTTREKAVSPYRADHMRYTDTKRVYQQRRVCQQRQTQCLMPTTVKDPESARTLGLTSLVDDPRKRAKNELLCKAKTCQQTSKVLAL
ncbi:hypothetical protein PanWU01x14_170010 [Parasponia andersonii]|uniref:Retrotransposon gag domain-containing protein n=1 Tax=Parasponia andersonii TaxID=3476 RepID=A0A2P5CA63_PARAD|nr:hypothetical protein PanWU01x14_170010 [Parasponia andersonii]